MVMNNSILNSIVMKKQNKEHIEWVSKSIVQNFPFVGKDVADWIGCLSSLETTYGKSEVCRFNCNLFGMKKPYYRLSTAISERLNHANYPTYTASICDFFLWLQYHGFSQDRLRNLDNFIYLFNSCNYNPSPDYVKTINLIYQSFKS